MKQLTETFKVDKTLSSESVSIIFIACNHSFYDTFHFPVVLQVKHNESLNTNLNMINEKIAETSGLHGLTSVNPVKLNQ